MASTQNAQPTQDSGVNFEPVIGLEVHAELNTRSKMFCSCAVVDSTQAPPNTAVCPVCAGMPGVLPVVNQQAVEYALRVALALECEVAPTSLFARKNYFYPDLPKGYQISQYEYPLAQYGRLVIHLGGREKEVRIRRVHLEEDTGKLVHVRRGEEAFSLVDLNRAGVPLLEIVSEPDLHSVEEMRIYTNELRSILRYLGVNSGNMEKGVIRFEANVSVREAGSNRLGTRVEVKNLNSFHSLERAVAYEINRQVEVIRSGGEVAQETLGWDEARGETFSQRSKEEAHDYRYFPEPDLPPLVIEQEWVERVRQQLPELPEAKVRRFQSQYGLSEYDARILAAEPPVAAYFEEAVSAAAPDVPAKTVANWIHGELFGLLNQSPEGWEAIRVSPQDLAGLLRRLKDGEINPATAKILLGEMFASGESSEAVLAGRELGQISDAAAIGVLIDRVLSEHPDQAAAYLAGKETLSHWFFGQVMRLATGRANPQIIQAELTDRLSKMKNRKDITS